MAGQGEAGYRGNRRERKKKKKREEAGAGAALPCLDMKQLVVQCSVPPHDAASFPTLAVARRLIHTHTSSPFPQQVCPRLQHLLQHSPCVGGFQTVPVSPSPPPFIINHTCPSSPFSLQQQVLLLDATPSPSKIAAAPQSPCDVQKQTCHPVDSTNLDANSRDCLLPSPAFADVSKQNTRQTPPLHESALSTEKCVASRACKPSRSSILSSLLAATEDGTALAAELLSHLKESLYSILPQSLKSKVSDDWDCMLSSSLLEQYMDNMKGIGKSSWLTDPSSFKRVIKKVSRNVPTNNRARKGHPGIEDLLDTIESFERAGLINELESLGFAEEACVLHDRRVFYGLFARKRVLQEVSSLLCFMRLEMHLPLQDTWSLACSDARHCDCLKEIREVCNFRDKIKTFAWKLDKLELCANEADSWKVKQEHEASSISNRLVKLFESPLGLELEGIRVVSYLDTAVSLLLHHVDIFAILLEHGFGEV